MRVFLEFQEALVQIHESILQSKIDKDMQSSMIEFSSRCIESSGWTTIRKSIKPFALWILKKISLTE